MINNLKINYEIDQERLMECGLVDSTYAISVSYQVNGFHGNCLIFKSTSGKLKMTCPTFTKRTRFKEVGIKRNDLKNALVNHPMLRLKLIFAGVK